MRVACVTMVYNEPEFLPIWISYYENQVGRENLFVVDHGSTDKVLDSYPGINVIRVPRYAKDNRQRTRFLSEFCSSLLHYYNSVTHTDVDEILVPDPRRFPGGLVDYCFSVKSIPAVTSIGLNVTHLPSCEAGFKLAKKVTWQRSWVRFVSPMCKPSVINEKTEWASGFHSCDHAPIFKDLYLFHLRYFDLELGLSRLERTRSMQWSSDKAGRHQRVDDETWMKWFEQFERFDRLGDFFSDTLATSTLSDCVDGFLAGEKVNSNGIRAFERIAPNQLLKIPAEFEGIF